MLVDGSYAVLLDEKLLDVGSQVVDPVVVLAVDLPVLRVKAAAGDVVDLEALRAVGDVNPRLELGVRVDAADCALRVLGAGPAALLASCHDGLLHLPCGGAGHVLLRVQDVLSGEGRAS